MITIELLQNQEILYLITHQQIQSYLDLLKIVNVILKKPANQFEAQYMFEDIDFANFYHYCYNKPIPVKLASDQQILDQFKIFGQTITVDQFIDLRKISVDNVECQKQDSQNIILEFYKDKLTEIKEIIIKLENNEDVDFDTVVDILNNIFEQMKDESKQVVPLMQQWIKEKKRAQNNIQLEVEKEEAQLEEVQSSTQQIQSEILQQVNNLSKIIEDRRTSQQDSAVRAQSARSQKENQSKQSKSQASHNSQQHSQQNLENIQNLQQIKQDIEELKTQTITYQQYQDQESQLNLTNQENQSNVLKQEAQDNEIKEDLDIQEQQAYQESEIKDVHQESEVPQQNIQEHLISEIRKQSELLSNLNEQNQQLISQNLKSDIQSQINEQTEFLDLVKKNSLRLQQIPDSINKYAQIDQQVAILEQVKNNIKNIYEQVTEASQVLEFAKLDPRYQEYKSNEESQKPSNQFLDNYQQLLNKAISQQKIASKILEQVNQNYDLQQIQIVKEYDTDQILKEFEQICQRSKNYLTKLEEDNFHNLQQKEEQQDCLVNSLANIIQRCDEIINFLNSQENCQRNIEEKQRFLKKNNSLKSLERTYSYKSLHQLPDQQQIQYNLAELIRRQAQLMQEIIEVNQNQQIYSSRSDQNEELEIQKQQSERIIQVEQLNEQILKSLSRVSEQNLQQENKQEQEVLVQQLQENQQELQQLKEPVIEEIQIIDQSYNEWHESIVKSVTQQVQNQLEQNPQNLEELEEQIKQTIHSQIQSQLQSKKNSIQQDFKCPKLEELIQDANKTQSSNAVEQAFRQSLLKQVCNQDSESKKSSLNNSKKLNQSESSQQPQENQISLNSSQRSKQHNQSSQHQKSQTSKNSQDLSKIRQQIKENSQILESVKSSQRGQEIRESYLQDAQQQLEVSQKILEQVNSYRAQISNRSSESADKLKESQTLLKVSQQIESNLIEKINEHQMVKEQVQQSQRSLMQSQQEKVESSLSQFHQSQLQSDAQLEQFVDQQIENLSLILAQVQEIKKQSEDNVRLIMNSVNQSKLYEKSDSPVNTQQQSFVSAENPKYSSTLQNDNKAKESHAPWHTLQEKAKQSQDKDLLNKDNFQTNYSPFIKADIDQCLNDSKSSEKNQQIQQILHVSNICQSQAESKIQPQNNQQQSNSQVQNNQTEQLNKSLQEVQKSLKGTQRSIQIELLQLVPEENDEQTNNNLINQNIQNDQKKQSQRSIRNQALQKFQQQHKNSTDILELPEQQLGEKKASDNFIKNIIESKVMNVIQDTKLQFPNLKTNLSPKKNSIKNENDELSELQIVSNPNIKQIEEQQNLETTQYKPHSKQFIHNIVKTQFFQVLLNDAKFIEEIPLMIQKSYSQKQVIPEQQILNEQQHCRQDSQLSKSSEEKDFDKNSKCQSSARIDSSEQKIQVPIIPQLQLDNHSEEVNKPIITSQQFIESVVAAKVNEILKESNIIFQQQDKSLSNQDLNQSKELSQQEQQQTIEVSPSEKFIQNIVESKVLEVIRQSKIGFKQPSPQKQRSTQNSQVNSNRSLENDNLQNDSNGQSQIQKSGFLTQAVINQENPTQTFLTPNKQIQLISNVLEQEKGRDSTGESKPTSELDIPNKQYEQKSARLLKKDLLNQKFEEIKLSLQKVSGSNNFIREQLTLQIKNAKNNI